MKEVAKINSYSILEVAQGESVGPRKQDWTMAWTSPNPKERLLGAIQGKSGIVFVYLDENAKTVMQNIGDTRMPKYSFLESVRALRLNAGLLGYF